MIEMTIDSVRIGLMNHSYRLIYSMMNISMWSC